MPRRQHPGVRDGHRRWRDGHLGTSTCDEGGKSHADWIRALSKDTAGKEEASPPQYDLGADGQPWIGRLEADMMQLRDPLYPLPQVARQVEKMLAGTVSRDALPAKAPPCVHRESRGYEKAPRFEVQFLIHPSCRSGDIHAGRSVTGDATAASCVAVAMPACARGCKPSQDPDPSRRYAFTTRALDQTHRGRRTASSSH